MKRDFFNAKTVTIITSCCHVATFFLFFLFCMCVCVRACVRSVRACVCVCVLFCFLFICLFVCAFIFEVAASDIKPCFAVM